MSASKIEWTQVTWNPVSGCTRVSAGCDNCYAVKMTHRAAAMGQEKKYGGLTVLNPKGERHFNGEVRCHEDALPIPLKRRKPTTYFVNSMSDLFHRDVPFEFIDKVFAVMAMTPQHTYQILTKRPGRMWNYFEAHYTRHKIGVIAREYTGKKNFSKLLNEDVGCDPDVCNHQCPLPNVWLGASVENQQTADERIPHLLKVPAEVRFLSCEPLLGPVDLSRIDKPLTGPGSNNPCAPTSYNRIDALSGWNGTLDHKNRGAGHHGPKVDWVIVGGESGSKSRECNIAWIRDIVEQCKSAGVPCFVKQLGSKPMLHEKKSINHSSPGLSIRVEAMEFESTFSLKHPKGGDPAEWPEDLRVREFPKVVTA